MGEVVPFKRKARAGWLSGWPYGGGVDIETFRAKSDADIAKAFARGDVRTAEAMTIMQEVLLKVWPARIVHESPGRVVVAPVGDPPPEAA